MAVIAKKDEKVQNVFAIIGIDCSFEEFKAKFIELYPGEWDKIRKTYTAHERRDTKKKGHPMPSPDKFIQNTFNVGKKKFLNCLKSKE